MGGIGGGLYQIFNAIGYVFFTILVGPTIASRLGETKPNIGGTLVGIGTGLCIAAFISQRWASDRWFAYFIGFVVGGVGGLLLGALLSEIVEKNKGQ